MDREQNPRLKKVLSLTIGLLSVPASVGYLAGSGLAESAWRTWAGYKSWAALAVCSAALTVSLTMLQSAEGRGRLRRRIPRNAFAIAAFCLTTALGDSLKEASIRAGLFVSAIGIGALVLQRASENPDATKSARAVLGDAVADSKAPPMSWIRGLRLTEKPRVRMIVGTTLLVFCLFTGTVIVAGAIQKAQSVLVGVHPPKRAQRAGATSSTSSTTSTSTAPFGPDGESPGNHGTGDADSISCLKYFGSTNGDVPEQMNDEFRIVGAWAHSTYGACAYLQPVSVPSIRGFEQPVFTRDSKWAKVVVWFDADGAIQSGFVTSDQANGYRRQPAGLDWVSRGRPHTAMACRGPFVQPFVNAVGDVVGVGIQRRKDVIGRSDEATYVGGVLLIRWFLVSVAHGSAAIPGDSEETDETGATRQWLQGLPPLRAPAGATAVPIAMQSLTAMCDNG